MRQMPKKTCELFTKNKTHEKFLIQEHIYILQKKKKS